MESDKVPLDAREMAAGEPASGWLEPNEGWLEPSEVHTAKGRAHTESSPATLAVPIAPAPPGPPMQSWRGVRAAEFAILGAIVVAALAIRLQSTGTPWWFTGNDPYAIHETVAAWMNGQNASGMYAYPFGSALAQPPLLAWLALPFAFAFSVAMGQDAAITLALETVVLLHVALLAFAAWALVKPNFGRIAALLAAGLCTIAPLFVSRTAWNFPNGLALGLAWSVAALALWPRATASAQAAFSHARRLHGWLWMLPPAGALALATLAWDGHAVVLASIAAAALLAVVRRGMQAVAQARVGAIMLAAAALAELPWAVTDNVAVAWLAALCALVVGLGAATRLRTDRMQRAVAAAALAAGAAVAFLVEPLRDAILLSRPADLDSRLASTIAEAQATSLSAFGQLGPWLLVAAAAGLVRVAIRIGRGRDADASLGIWAILGFAATLAHSRSMPALVVPMGILAAIGAAWPAQRFLVAGDRSPRTSRPAWWGAAGTCAVIVAALVVGPTIALATIAGKPLAEPDSIDTQEEYEAMLRAWDYESAYSDGRDVVDVPAECLFLELYSCGTGNLGTYNELAGNGWPEALAPLASRDTDQAPAARPAVLAWWDYGDWIISLGDHPAVADPNSVSYLTASHFLTSTTEADAQGWIVQLLLAQDADANGGRPSAAVAAALAPYGEALGQRSWTVGSQADHDALMDALPGEAVFSLYANLTAATGHAVGYVMVDDRMGPFLTPEHPSQSSGILYAPLLLAGKNPDDYIQTVVPAGFSGALLTMRSYEPAPGGGYQLISDGRETYVDDEANEWAFRDGLFYPMGDDPRGPGARGLPSLGELHYQATAAYSRTMYARSFGGVASSLAPAGEGLSHWKVIHESSSGEFCVGSDPFSGGCTEHSPLRQVVLLAYVP